MIGHHTFRTGIKVQILVTGLFSPIQNYHDHEHIVYNVEPLC